MLLRAIPLVFLLVSAPATASPIVTTISGIATGSLKGKAFASASFNIEAISDTAGVEPTLIESRDMPPFIGGWHLDNLAASISIVGFPTATITTPTFIFVGNLAPGATGLTAQVDVIALHCEDCETWDLTTSFGPVFDANPFGLSTMTIDTSEGPLIMSAASDATFQAVVPEPSLVVLGSLEIGILGAALVRERHARSRRARRCS